MIMDCVLHRSEVWRHVLYNREPFAGFVGCWEVCGGGGRVGLGDKKEDDTTSNNNINNNSGRKLRNVKDMLRYSVMTWFLRTYLWYVANQNKGGDNKSNSSSDGSSDVVLLRVLMQYALGDVVLVMTTIFVASLLVLKTTAATANNTNKRENNTPSQNNAITTSNNNTASFFYSRLYLALTIPIFFHVVTLFVLIWENSSTVCLLGTLLVISLQSMAVATVMEERVRRESIILQQEGVRGDNHGSSTKREHGMLSYIPGSLPFIAGVATRALLLRIASQVTVIELGTLKFPSPCLSLDILMSYVS